MYDCTVNYDLRNQIAGMNCAQSPVPKEPATTVSGLLPANEKQGANSETSPKLLPRTALLCPQQLLHARAGSC